MFDTYIKSFFRSIVPGRNLLPDQLLPVYNPWNEIQLLEGHKDIIRVLIKIDDCRFASGGDDGRIILWESQSGDPIFELKDHTGPITCLLVLGLSSTLVSGSVDKSICLWDTITGNLLVSIKNSHAGGIKSIIALTTKTFCSGGTDRYIRVWNNEGTKLFEIERKESEESINCMLAISDYRVITGSSNDLLVYRTDMKQFSQKFSISREPVHCLVRVNEETFVSGSLDGVIVVWQMESLTPLRKLNDPEKYFISTEDSKRFTESVNNLLVLGKRYLAACIDKGFKIYDICTGDIIMEKTQAHDSQVYSIICVGGGTHLITASADASIKIWCTEKNFNFLMYDYQPGGIFSRKTKAFYPPICIGEMSIHNDQVKHLLKISETAFISGGHDMNLILWKNGDFESQLRNLDALHILRNSSDIDLYSSQTDTEINPPSLTGSEEEMRSKSDKESSINATRRKTFPSYNDDIIIIKKHQRTDTTSREKFH